MTDNGDGNNQLIRSLYDGGWPPADASRAPAEELAHGWSSGPHTSPGTPGAEPAPGWPSYDRAPSQGPVQSPTSAPHGVPTPSFILSQVDSPGATAQELAEADASTTRGRRALRQEMSKGFRRSLRLTALSTLFPGAGLLRTRGRAIGWIVVSLFLLAGAAGAVFVAKQGVKRTGLVLLSRADNLQKLILIALAAGAVWALSIIITAVASRPPWLDRSRRRVLAAFTALMVGLIGSGTYKVFEYASVTKDTVAALTSHSTPGTGAKVIVDEPDVDPWRDTPRVNLLIIGSDAGRARVGTRTDSMVVASIDTTTGRTVLVQLPRSLEKAPLAEDSPLRALYPDGSFGLPRSACRAQMGGDHECLLTNLWHQADAFASDNPGAYKGVESPGRLENRRTIELITGLKIDNEMIVNLEGFKALIDAMGGVDVTVKGGGYDGKRRIPIEGKSDGNGGVIGEKGWFKFGLQHMDGYHALWYARARAIDDDTGRQSRQRCVIRAMVSQVNPGKMLAKYAEVAKIVRDNIWIDIAPEHLPAYVELLERIQKAQLVSLPITPAQKIYAGDPDYARVRRLVQSAINPPKPAPTTTPSATATTTPGATPKPTSTSTPKPTTTKKPTDQDNCE